VHSSGVIQGCGLRKFGAAIKKKDVAKGKAAMELASDPTVDPYVLCCRSTLNDVYTFACELSARVRDSMRD
jgi:hypothetical protein